MSARGPGRPLLVVAGLVVVAVLAVALWVIGSPAAQRQVRLDERREADLQRIENAIGRHWEKQAALPADLPTLAGAPGVVLPVVDPVDGTPYAFVVVGPRAYRLCAVFATDTAARAAGNGARNDRWAHTVGRQCFDLSVEANK